MTNSSATPTHHAERLTVACVLSLVGGFLDVYTYLFRGEVFANAVTGNMVLLGMDIAQQKWLDCGRYLLAICFYALGIFVAEFIQAKIDRFKLFTWHQLVILLELGCLILVYFIPYGDPDLIVNALIAFVCALQVQTFRRVKGFPFASTMCTGNLRSGTDALYSSIQNKDRAEFNKALHYYGIIVCFIFGAAAGAILLNHWGKNVFLLAPVGLAVAFFMITSKRTLVSWRKPLKKFLRK